MGYFNDEYTKQKMDLKEGFDFRHVQVRPACWGNNANMYSLVGPSISIFMAGTDTPVTVMKDGRLKEGV
jgi:hypothetical protein